MKRHLFFASIIIGTIIGCDTFGGAEHPPQTYNTAYPNNGAWGDDATPYEPDAGDDAQSIDTTDAEVEANTSNCITECNALQCGIIRNQCGGFVSCTPCRDNEECVNNTCRAKTPDCTPENNASFCTRYAVRCGAHTGLDNCGLPRTVVDCGGACAGVCFNNACCIPETPSQTCVRLGKECGDISATNNCGILQVATCAPCLAGLTCRAGRCETAVVTPPPVP